MKRRQDPKIKLTVYVSRIVAEQLDFACKDRTKNKSKLTETALSRLLSPKAEDQHDAVVPRRLDRLTRDIGVINRHQQIVVESLGLFIRHYLITSLPLPPQNNRQRKRWVISASSDLLNSSADGSQAQQHLRMKSPTSLQTRLPSQTRQSPKAQNRIRRTQRLRRKSETHSSLARWAVASS